MVTQHQARQWLDRWERQQERCVADREERFTIICDVVQHTAGREDPLVLDLGVGPGSLAVRLLDRLPQASVVGVDADPLLLGLARAAHGERAGLRVVEHDLRQPGWVGRLALDRPADAIVSTTALHWLTGPQLACVYQACAELLLPGGVLVNGDHLHEEPGRPQLDELTRTVTRCRAERAATSTGEEWEAWWGAATSAGELADLVAARGPDGVAHHVENPATFDEHVRLLQKAGFGETGTVWQHGDNRVLVAVR